MSGDEVTRPKKKSPAAAIENNPVISIIVAIMTALGGGALYTGDAIEEALDRAVEKSAEAVEEQFAKLRLDVQKNTIAVERGAEDRAAMVKLVDRMEDQAEQLAGIRERLSSVEAQLRREPPR